MSNAKYRRKTNRTVEEIIDSFVSPVSDSEKNRRIQANQDIAIYNRKSSILANPFAGDTTVLPFGVDNTPVTVPQTVDEIIDSVLHPTHKPRMKRNGTRLLPDAASPEVQEYWLQKIRGSALRSARAYQEMTKTPKITTMEEV